jgi:WbqC-like protein family
VKPILIESQYLPSVEFFCAVATANEIQIEMCEHFVKQSYRNHTFINTTNGKIKLTVPLSNKGNRSIIRDIKIDGSGNWKNNQWRTIESAYRNSPYYEHYVDDLQQTIFTPHIYLVDLNLSLLSLCLNWLRWQKKISSTKVYQANPADCTDLRNVLLSKKSYSTRNYYRPAPYTQVFGNNFVGNLSLIDLIFCKGPESTNLLSASRPSPL